MMMTMMMGRDGRLISVAASSMHTHAGGMSVAQRCKWTNEVVDSDGVCKLPLMCLFTC